MTTAIWRVSDRLNIVSVYPEFAEEGVDSNAGVLIRGVVLRGGRKYDSPKKPAW